MRKKNHNLNSRISRFQKRSSIFFITKFKFELKLKYNDTVSPLFFIIDLIFRWTRIKKNRSRSVIYLYVLWYLNLVMIMWRHKVFLFHASYVSTLPHNTTPHQNPRAIFECLSVFRRLMSALSIHTSLPRRQDQYHSSHSLQCSLPRFVPPLSLPPITSGSCWQHSGFTFELYRMNGKSITRKCYKNHTTRIE